MLQYQHISTKDPEVRRTGGGILAALQGHNARIVPIVSYGCASAHRGSHTLWFRIEKEYWSITR